MINTQFLWRFRLVAMAAFAVTLWSASRGHTLLRGVHGGFALGLAGAWVGAVFLSRKEPWNRIAVAIGLGASAFATLLDPGLNTLLLVSVGWVGAHTSWRRMSSLGVLTVLFACVIIIVSSGHVTSWAAAAALVSSPQFLSSLLTIVFPYSIVLLLGRVATDNVRVRREQAEALEELRAAHAELQKRHKAVAELATLRERARLARELHDTLGHALSAITVQLEAVRRLLQQEPARADALLREAQEEARAAMGDLRLYLSELRAPGGPADLSHALRSLAEAMARESGWVLDADLAEVSLPERLRAALYHVAREALTNCQRHAQAKHVRMRLAQQATQIILEVQDDGQGFDASSIAEGHFGIAGMRERLAELGGEIALDTGRGRGTAVVAALPMPQPPGT